MASDICWPEKNMTETDPDTAVTLLFFTLPVFYTVAIFTPLLQKFYTAVIVYFYTTTPVRRAKLLSSDPSLVIFWSDI